MNVSRKRLLFAASLLLLGVAGAVSLLIALGRFRPGGSGVDDTASPVSNTPSASLAAPGEKSRTGPGTDAWKNPGRQWRVQVKKYSEPNYGSAVPKIYREYMGVEDKPSVQNDFTMLVRSLPLRHRGDHDIARFQFTPAGKAPDHMAGEQYVLDVDVQTGQAVDLHSAELRPWDRVRTFGADKYLETQLWFPVDWMLRNSDLAAIPLEKTYLLPSRGASGEPASIFKTVEPTVVPARGAGGAGKRQPAVRVEWVMRQADAPKEYQNEYRLAQVWVPGEPWWRSFHRYRSGRPELEAFWVGDE